MNKENMDYALQSGQGVPASEAHVGIPPWECNSTGEVTNVFSAGNVVHVISFRQVSDDVEAAPGPTR